MLARPEINFNRTPVTLVIAAVAVALEVVCSLDEPRRAECYKEYLGILPLIWTGQIWRPFTSCLMHGDLLHAAFNVYWLVIFGPVLENRFGPYRTLGLIVLLGYVSMMPQFVIGSYRMEGWSMIVGLSGIVYGLFGILFIGRRWQKELNAVCSDQTSVLLLGWFVLCILMTAGGVMRVANIAHGAGFGFGVLYGLAIFDVRRRLRWTILASVASAIVLSTLIACPGHNGYELIRDNPDVQWVTKETDRSGLREAPFFTSHPAASSASRPPAPDCRSGRSAGSACWGS